MKNQEDQQTSTNIESEIATSNLKSPSLIDTLKTPYEKSKIPFKKLNYKSLMYKKRIHFGRLENIGLTINELRFIPYVMSNNNDYISSNVKLNEDKIKDNSLYLNEDNFNKNLSYSIDEILHPKISRRELHLKKLLQCKLNEFIQLSKLK